MSDNAHFIFVLLSIKLCLLLFIGSSLIICHCPLNNVRLLLVLFCRSQRHFLLWLLFRKELLIMSVILNMMTTICFVWFSVKIGRRRKKIYFVESIFKGISKRGTLDCGEGIDKLFLCAFKRIFMSWTRWVNFF